MCNNIVFIFIANSETNTSMKYNTIAIVMYFNIVIFITSNVTIAKCQYYKVVANFLRKNSHSDI